MIDDDFGSFNKWPLPTREGPATGHASERQMLDRGGLQNDGFRTDLRLNADGSTTMLRTRGGHPEFTTTPPEEEESATLYCRMMSDQYPLGAEVTRSGQAYTTQNAALDWPTYPTSKGRIGARITAYRGKRAELAADYPDSPGNSTWYDTRTGAARQFTDVLSWSNCMSENLSEGPYYFNGPLSSYYNAHYSDYSGFVVGTTSHYSPSGSKSHSYGDYLPAHAINRGTRDYRYVPDPYYAVSLYKNGQILPISSMILAACMVLVGGGTRYRVIRPKWYELAVSTDMELVVDEFDDDGSLLSSVDVTLPSGLQIRNIPVAPRWNASGTEAACSVEHLASEVNAANESVLSTDILLIASDGSSSIGPSYGSHDFGDSAAPGIQKSNKVMALDYIGDELIVLRREESTLASGSAGTVSDTTTTLPWQSWTGQTNNFDCLEVITNKEHLSERTTTYSGSSTVSAQLILEPGGVIYSASGSATTSSYSTLTYGGFVERKVAPGTYECGTHTGYWFATEATATQGRSDTASGEAIVSVLADLRKGLVFVFTAEGSSLNSGGDTASWTGADEFSIAPPVSVGYNDTYTQNVTCRLKLVTGGAATTLKSFSGTFQSDGTTARNVSAQGGIVPEYVAPSPPTPPVTPVSNSISGFGFAGGTGGLGHRDRYAINSPVSNWENFSVPVYFSANVGARGRVAVVSCAIYTATSPSDSYFSGGAIPDLANFVAANKLLTRADSGPWSVADFSLPTYDGTVKWIGEPLIL